MRLTSREKEIFDALKKEPLISQEELANRFGITRSSAAVHISNLMKKGVILGKGYVFNEQAVIVILGDIYLQIDVDTDNNKIDVRHSGSAFELSLIFARFGIAPKVMTVVGNDDLGTDMLMQLQKRNIDTSNIIRLSNVRTCRRIFTHNNLTCEEGFAPAEIKKAFEAREWVTFNCEYLVVDPRFQEIVYQRSATKEEDKLPQLCTYFEPPRDYFIPDFLGSYSVVAMGLDSNGIDACVPRCMDLTAGKQNLFILTDGSSRLMYVNSEGVHDFPLLPGQRFEIDSGIPRMLAGLVYGLSNHYPIRQAVRFGIGAASIGE